MDLFPRNLMELNSYRGKQLVNPVSLECLHDAFELETGVAFLARPLS